MFHLRHTVFARRAYCVSASNFSCVCVRSCVRASFAPVLDEKTQILKGFAAKKLLRFDRFWIQSYHFWITSLRSWGFRGSWGFRISKTDKERCRRRDERCEVVVFWTWWVYFFCVPLNRIPMLAEECRRGAGRMEDSHAWHHRLGNSHTRPFGRPLHCRSYLVI